MTHRHLARKLALTGALIAAGAALVGSTHGAFTADTLSAANSVAAGTVKIEDNDSGGAVLRMSLARPGDTDVGCIKVDYTGTLTSNVRLYGTTTGTGLDPYITLTVTRGTQGSPSFDSCTGFTADPVNHIGAGNGVMYTGTLQAFPDSYATGYVDPTLGSPESWTNGETHVYQFDITLQNNAAAAGKTATQSFTWEARNI